MKINYTCTKLQENITDITIQSNDTTFSQRYIKTINFSGYLYLFFEHNEDSNVVHNLSIKINDIAVFERLNYNGSGQLKDILIVRNINVGDTIKIWYGKNLTTYSPSIKIRLYVFDTLMKLLVGNLTDNYADYFTKSTIAAGTYTIDGIFQLYEDTEFYIFDNEFRLTGATIGGKTMGSEGTNARKFGIRVIAKGITMTIPAITYIAMHNVDSLVI